MITHTGQMKAAFESDTAAETGHLNKFIRLI